MSLITKLIFFLNNFLYLAGIIEFLGSLAVICGFLIRFSSFGLVLYLLIATFLGHHFSLGFI
jgi:putative oxidoreductase